MVGCDKLKIPAEVVHKARKRLEDDTNKRFQELSPKVQQLQEAIKATADAIAADKKGVEIREQYFNDLHAKLWATLQAVGDERSATTIETQNVLQDAQELREEGYRLANQLDLIRNDKFSASVQQKMLEDELTRLEENRNRLEQRQAQLKQQLDSGY